MTGADAAWYLFFLDYQRGSEYIKLDKGHVAATFPDLTTYSVSDFNTLMQGLITYQPPFAKFCVKLLNHMTLPGNVSVASLQKKVPYCTVLCCVLYCISPVQYRTRENFSNPPFGQLYSTSAVLSCIELYHSNLLLLTVHAAALRYCCTSVLLCYCTPGLVYYCSVLSCTALSCTVPQERYK